MEDHGWKLRLKAETIPVFEAILHLDAIKSLYLFGGTAQAIQMMHRKSEYLDFELLGTTKSRLAFDFTTISSEVSALYPDCRKEYLGNNHLQIFVDGGVKLSFFRPDNAVPCLGKGFVYNNIVTPSLQELLGTKLFTVTVRSAFRDYYDIYSLLREGYDLEQGVAYAGRFSRHAVHSKTIYSILLNENYFTRPNDFSLLDPIYDVTSKDIAGYIKDYITTHGVKIKGR